MAPANANNGIPRAGAFARLALIALAGAVLLAVVGYWPTTALAGARAGGAMLVGIAVALVGAWAGIAPTIAWLKKPAQEHLVGIMLGLGIRFGVTIGLAVAIWATDTFDKQPLLLWVGLAQFVLLGVDVPGLTALLRRAAKEAS